ncbi:MAG: hypothetical protein JWQ09_4816 [Segetibacter sp.]|nr:hypothetical protein [Segetibacter sp.]
MSDFLNKSKKVQECNARRPPFERITAAFTAVIQFWLKKNPLTFLRLVQDNGFWKITPSLHSFLSSLL